MKKVCRLKPAARVRRWVGALMVLLSLLLCSVAPAQQRPSKAQTGSKVSIALNENGNKEIQNRATSNPSYVIGPEDVLDISVWKEPEVYASYPCGRTEGFHYRCCATCRRRV